MKAADPLGLPGGLLSFGSLRIRLRRFFVGWGTPGLPCIKKRKWGRGTDRDFAKLQMELTRTRTIPKGGPPTPTGRPRKKKSLKFKLFLVLGR